MYLYRLLGTTYALFLKKLYSWPLYSVWLEYFECAYLKKSYNVQKIGELLMDTQKCYIKKK